MIHNIQMQKNSSSKSLLIKLINMDQIKADENKNLESNLQILPKIAKHNWIKGKIFAKLAFLNPNKSTCDRVAAFNLDDSKNFENEMDGLVKEICQGFVKENLVPNLIVGESDRFAILLKRLKEIWPNCKFFGVTSDLDSNQELDNFSIPQVSVSEREIFRAARDLNIKEKLSGGAGERSGAVIAGLVQKIKNSNFSQDANFVAFALLPDNLENSKTSKFLNIEYMLEKGYMGDKELNSLYWWYTLGVGNLRFVIPPFIHAKIEVGKVSDIFKQGDHTHFLLWNGECPHDSENIFGVLEIGDINIDDFCKIWAHEDMSTSITQHGMLSYDSKLSELNKLFQFFKFVLIYAELSQDNLEDPCKKYKAPLSLITKKDMDQWIESIEEHHRLQSDWDPGYEAPPKDDNFGK